MAAAITAIPVASASSRAAAAKRRWRRVRRRACSRRCRRVSWFMGFCLSELSARAASPGRGPDAASCGAGHSPCGAHGNHTTPAGGLTTRRLVDPEGLWRSARYYRMGKPMRPDLARAFDLMAAAARREPRPLGHERLPLGRRAGPAVGSEAHWPTITRWFWSPHPRPSENGVLAHVRRLSCQGAYPLHDPRRTSADVRCVSVPWGGPERRTILVSVSAAPSLRRSARSKRSSSAVSWQWTRSW